MRRIQDGHGQGHIFASVKRWSALALFVVLPMLLLACSGPDPTPTPMPTSTPTPTATPTQVAVGQKFTLKAQETVEVATAYFVLSFLGVTQDSRCPSDVVCVRAGDVTVELSAISANGNSETFTPTIAPSGRATVRFDRYDITVSNVQPYPVSTKPIEQKDYAIGVLVEPVPVEPTPTPTPSSQTPKVALSILDRECTTSHTTKIPSAPDLLCDVEVPNVVIYSDGLVVYHAWEKEYYGSRTGGELRVGQLAQEELDDVLAEFVEAGIFTAQGLPTPSGDASYYVVSASFGGKNASLVLDPFFSQEKKSLLGLVEEFLDFQEWAKGRGDFQETGAFSPASIRLRVQPAFVPASDEWPLPEITLEDGSVLSGERAEAIRELVSLGWFGHYRYQGADYVVGYTPQLPHGWPQ